MSVKTRFAPSPTGYLHIGGVRTALYCWLFARHHGGEFLLRIEDTDRERSTDAAIEAILNGMQWLGLDADSAPVFQTQRFDAYREALDRMLRAIFGTRSTRSPDAKRHCPVVDGAADPERG